MNSCHATDARLGQSDRWLLSIARKLHISVLVPRESSTLETTWGCDASIAAVSSGVARASTLKIDTGAVPHLV